MNDKRKNRGLTLIPDKGFPLKEDDKFNELIQDCADGDQDSLKHFFHIFSKEIYDFPIKIFHLDEDSASEYFIYAYERLKDGKRLNSYSRKSSFRTWFYSVLRNLVIDWLRTKKDLSVPPGNGEEPPEAREVEDPIDFRQINAGIVPEEMALEFRKKIRELDLEDRVYIKLCFIYYLDVEMDEILYIKEKSGRSESDILMAISSLKTILADKEELNLRQRGKIISLNNSILSLKEKRTRILGKINDLYSRLDDIAKKEIYDLNMQLFELDGKVQKKYSTRANLLEKSLKGLYMVRTPYRYIKDLLNMPRGTIAVKIMNATKNFKDSMSDLVEIYL